MDLDLARRRALLTAALGFCQLSDMPAFSEVMAVKRWLSTWNGIGHVVVGMERLAYALSLRKLVDDGWHAAWEQHRCSRPSPTPTLRHRSGRSSTRHGAR